MNAERRYALRTLGRSVYLALSNDASELWVVHAYDEIGDVELADGSKLVGRFWRGARILDHKALSYGLHIDHDDDDGTITGFWMRPNEDPGGLAWDATGNDSLQFGTRREALDWVMSKWAPAS